MLNKIYSTWLETKNITIDTRTIKEGDIFFAIKGKNFNGNLFAQEAIDKGAKLVVLDEPITIQPKEKVVYVKNALHTLQALSRKYRDSFSIPFIGITGSNGKTTTKELLYSVLSSKYRTVATKGNLNNHIGVPLTLLNISTNCEIAIIEMGANHIGEIATYCKIANPNFGLITNIGKAHIGEFGSFENIIQAKTELYDFCQENNGTIFYNIDDNLLKENIANRKNISSIQYGKNVPIRFLEFLKNAEGLSFSFQFKDKKEYTIQSHLFGEYNLSNILASMAIGLYFNIPIEKIIQQINNYKPTNQRSQKIQYRSNTYIIDTYNANPSSMLAAITSFFDKKNTKAYYILGGMKELGKYSFEEHQNIINYLLKLGIKDNVLLIGEEFKNTKHPFIFLPNAIELKKWLEKKNIQNAHFLFKGSRSIQLEIAIKDIIDYGS